MSTLVDCNAVWTNEGEKKYPTSKDGRFNNLSDRQMGEGQGKNKEHTDG